MDYLLPVTGGKMYTTNADIRITFYDKDRNPVNDIDVLVKKNKDIEKFKVPMGIEAISIIYINKTNGIS